MKYFIAAAAIALSSTAAFAEGASGDSFTIEKPTVGFIDATQIVDRATDGEIIGLDLEYINDSRSVYLADVEAQSGFYRLMIDGKSGEVLVTESINAQNEDVLVEYLENYSTQAEMAAQIVMAMAYEAVNACEGIEDFDVSLLDDVDFDDLDEMTE